MKKTKELIDDHSNKVAKECQIKNINDFMDCVYDGLNSYFEDGDCSSCPFGREVDNLYYCSINCIEGGLEDSSCSCVRDDFKAIFNEIIEKEKKN